jgi:2,3-bisphosphoglycerate-independent phosphoglycerate mutase
MTTPKRPVVLVILDGWGVRHEVEGNAVLAASTPVMDRLLSSHPSTTLQCSGEDVGLPAGQMGNSEVGHLNLGAGFIVYQWITRIDRAIADGSFARNPALRQAFESAAANNGRVHLMGLVSDGGVHSHARHLDALIHLAGTLGARDVLIHAFTDGRDTSPRSGLESIRRLESALRERRVGRIASVTGRYYAMDRDHRWERTSAAFNAIAHGEGHRAESAESAVAGSYERERTDEFIEPTVIPDANGDVQPIRPNDAVIFFNFRADRGRQLTEALAAPDFAAFDRGTYRPPASIVTMTTYEASLPVQVAFSPHDVEEPLAKAISDAGMTQLHTAETEKYAHVTFFLNGGREEPFPGEERELVPSPRVATYDLQPEMSAPAVRDGVIRAITSGLYDFIIVNFANCDMVGHTGVFAAAVRAVETVDGCLGSILETLDATEGIALITADHGNAEMMIDPATGGPFTAHTTNPVPVVLWSPQASPFRSSDLRGDGVLSAVAPTVLHLLGIDPPASMTQVSLIDEPGLTI